MQIVGEPREWRPGWPAPARRTYGSARPDGRFDAPTLTVVPCVTNVTLLPACRLRSIKCRGYFDGVLEGRVPSLATYRNRAPGPMPRSTSRWYARSNSITDIFPGSRRRRPVDTPQRIARPILADPMKVHAVAAMRLAVPFPPSKATFSADAVGSTSQRQRMNYYLGFCRDGGGKIEKPQWVGGVNRRGAYLIDATTLWHHLVGSVPGHSIPIFECNMVRTIRQQGKSVGQAVFDSQRPLRKPSA